MQFGAGREQLKDLPIYEGDYVRLQNCICDTRQIGQVLTNAMSAEGDGMRWTKICMQCGSIWIDK